MYDFDYTEEQKDWARNEYRVAMKKALYFSEELEKSTMEKVERLLSDREVAFFCFYYAAESNILQHNGLYPFIEDFSDAIVNEMRNSHKATDEEIRTKLLVFNYFDVAKNVFNEYRDEEITGFDATYWADQIWNHDSNKR